MQFRVGDIVRAVREQHGWYREGDILTVKSHSGPWVRVDSTIHQGKIWTNGGFYAEDFELVTSAEGNTNTMKKVAAKTDTNASIIRLLTSVAVINSATFAKAAPVKQTEILALANGKTVLFVENFAKLGNTKLLAQRLLAGEDVRMELEFNNIDLSDDERKAIDAVRPVLEKLNALKSVSGYNWPDEDALQTARTHFSRMSNNTVQTSSGYSCQKATAKRIWDKVAPFYMGDAERPRNMELASISGYSYRRVTFNDDGSIQIGCQSLTRLQVEAVAKHFGFDYEPK